MPKNKELTPFYMKISQDLKDRLQAQAKLERIPMVTLVSQLLEQGLMIRPKMRQDNIDKLVEAAGMVGAHDGQN